jgi:hypothetical protein
MCFVPLGGGNRLGIFCPLLQSSHSLPRADFWEDLRSEQCKKYLILLVCGPDSATVVGQMVTARGAEESTAWRQPVDL